LVVSPEKEISRTGFESLTLQFSPRARGNLFSKERLMVKVKGPLKRCVCRHRPDLYEEDGGYRISCPRCGRESKLKETFPEAIRNWNRSLKSMRFIDANAV
jgi:hypothetical protein